MLFAGMALGAACALARRLIPLARPGVDYVLIARHDILDCDWQDLVTGLTKAILYLHHKLPDLNTYIMMSWMMQTFNTLMRIFLTGLVQLYQLCLSPLLGECHLPTCSHYAKDALNMHTLSVIFALNVSCVVIHGLNPC